MSSENNKFLFVNKNHRILVDILNIQSFERIKKKCQTTDVV
jgi:hypothetical protein